MTSEWSGECTRAAALHTTRGVWYRHLIRWGFLSADIRFRGLSELPSCPVPGISWSSSFFSPNSCMFSCQFHHRSQQNSTHRCIHFINTVEQHCLLYIVYWMSFFCFEFCVHSKCSKRKKCLTNHCLLRDMCDLTSCHHLNIGEMSNFLSDYLGYSACTHAYRWQWLWARADNAVQHDALPGSGVF